MKRTPLLYLCLPGLLTSLPGIAASQDKILVAHRGASAYAPEHTREAYELAISQGADYIEPDLQLTRDGIFICLHDATLDRTTDVKVRFPDRRTTRVVAGRTIEGWFASDFTLEEIRSLDAGSWFDPQFARSRIVTFEGAVEIARGRVGVFPELKNSELYRDRAPLLEVLFHQEATRLRLGPDPGLTPALVQSFDADILKRLQALGSPIPRVFLFGSGGAGRLEDEAALREIAKFAHGIGPAKEALIDRPALVPAASRLGLMVIPYTFRSSRVPDRFPDVAAEMSYFLYELGVDGVFTDNPDQFPRRPGH